VVQLTKVHREAKPRHPRTARRRTFQRKIFALFHLRTRIKVRDMKRIFVALLLLAIVPISNAQDTNSSHYKAAEQMLTLMDMPTVLKKSVDDMVAMQVQQNPSIAPYETVMKEFLAKYMSWDSLKADMIQIYMDEFTESELGELNKFYQTPVGRKAVERMPSLMTKGAQLGGQRVQQHMPELQAAITAEAQKQGVAGAGGSPGSGSSKASASPTASPKKK
jgi:hypothetical protein